MPNFDENTVQKFINVLKLANGAKGHEQVAATSAARKMAEKYPGIKEEVERRVRLAQVQQAQTKKPTPSKSSTPAGVWEKDVVYPSSPSPKTTGNWENIFSFLGDFYEGVAGAVRAAMVGARLAQEVSMTRNTRMGATYLSLRIPTSTLIEVRKLEPAQRDVFRGEVLRLLDEELMALLDS